MSAASAEPSEPERIARAVLDLDDVVGMSSGPLGQFRSYLPGASVPGVGLDDDLIEIHVVVAHGARIAELGERVTAALKPWRRGRDVVVNVEDVLLPGDEQPSPDVVDVAERDTG